MTDDLQIVNFTVGEVNYGVPVHQVREILGMQPVTPVPGTAHFVLGVSNLRGQIITVMDLKLLLGLQGADDGGRKIIWVQHHQYMVGIIVDQVTEVSTIPGGEIDAANNDGTGINEYTIGVGKQRDRLVVLLDFYKIIDGNFTRLLIQSDEPSAPEQPIPA
ncbi:chemotaxis protein CheW [Candidatus Bathyarchaeota archaeon]|nr:chemotaxis protein CheW [Candidatus Bathyarchaeota archaeon]